MAGRAEFAYLIAQMSFTGGLMTADMFAVVIWALLWATFLSPVGFKWALKRYIAAQGALPGLDADIDNAFVELTESSIFHTAHHRHPVTPLRSPNRTPYSSPKQSKRTPNSLELTPQMQQGPLLHTLDQFKDGQFIKTEPGTPVPPG
jgi:hypothetical protein